MGKILRLGIIAGACGILGLAVGFGMQAIFEEGLFRPAGTRQVVELSCALRENASAYGDFREIVEVVGSDSRRTGRPGGPEPSHPAYRMWEGDSFRGSVTSLIYESPYKEDNEQFARSWGARIPPEEGPFVPLAGSEIVVDHPGLLEVYQTNIAFSSEEGASDKISRLQRANEPTLVSQGEVPAGIGDQIVIWQRNPEVEKGERTVGVGVRLDRVVIGFSFQGGTALTVADVLPHVRNAISTLEAACGGDQYE